MTTPADVTPEQIAQKSMLADLARRMAEQSQVIATGAAKHAAAAEGEKAWEELGRSKGYRECAEQLLLVARNF